MRDAADQPTPVSTEVRCSGAGCSRPAILSPQSGVAFSSLIGCTADHRRTCCVASLASAAGPPHCHCSPISNQWVGCSVACSSSRPRCTATAGWRAVVWPAGCCYTQFLSKSITFLGWQGGCIAVWPRSAGRDSRCRPAAARSLNRNAPAGHTGTATTTFSQAAPLLFFS